MLWLSFFLWPGAGVGQIKFDRAVVAQWQPDAGTGIGCGFGVFEVKRVASREVTDAERDNSSRTGKSERFDELILLRDQKVPNRSQHLHILLNGNFVDDFKFSSLRKRQDLE